MARDAEAALLDPEGELAAEEVVPGIRDPFKNIDELIASLLAREGFTRGPARVTNRSWATPRPRSTS